MKGQILDVYPEGSKTFRACVLDGPNEYDFIYVVDLNTGDTLWASSDECGKWIIKNIFDICEGEAATEESLLDGINTEE